MKSHLRNTIIATFYFFLASSSYAQQQPTLEIAIAPFLPVKTLVQNYEPMRTYLENRLQEPVTFISAPDYLTFYEHTRKREFSFIITTAHAAWLASTDTGYIPLLRPTNLTRPTLVTRNESKISRIAELKGKIIAMSDAAAIVSMQGLKILGENGLQAGRDFTLLHKANHAVAINHLIASEVDAAIVSDRAIQQMPASSREKIRVVMSWDKVAAPGVIFMASPALPKQRITLVRQAILEFSSKTPEGQKMMRDFGYNGLESMEVDDLKKLEEYGLQLRTLIKTKN